jgi:hypothetical protein
VAEREHGRGDGREPLDEEAAWAQIVAGYGEEPPEPPGVWPKSEATERTESSDDGLSGQEPDGDAPTGSGSGGDGYGDGEPVRSYTVYSAGTGPRDWKAPEPSEDEGHFVPPEPPPLPRTDAITKFAWLSVVGGPLLLIGMILFRQEMTWWVTTLGIGGFLGGFATLVARMRDGRDDDSGDPGRGAVV